MKQRLAITAIIAVAFVVGIVIVAAPAIFVYTEICNPIQTGRKNALVHVRTPDPKIDCQLVAIGYDCRPAHPDSDLHYSRMAARDMAAFLSKHRGRIIEAAIVLAVIIFLMIKLDDRFFHDGLR